MDLEKLFTAFELPKSDDQLTQRFTKNSCI